MDGEYLSRIDRDAYRREKVSVIYQAFHLFPLLTALENVMYPLELQGMARKEAKEKAAEYLEEVGISKKLHGQYPKMMSGGEQQRTACLLYTSCSNRRERTAMHTGITPKKTSGG